MEKTVNEIKAKNNIKLYKKYKLFSYDFLFYYAVEVLFFTIVKGFSMSELMYISAIYTFSAFFWQLTGSTIVEKIGLKNSIVFGNILVSICSFLYIISSKFWMYNVINFVLALGFSLKSLAEGSLLYSSLKKIGKREKFSEVEGKSNSRFYYFDALSSLVSGFLFVVNGYIPFILCFVCTIVSLAMSFEFENFEKEKEYEESVSIKDTFLGLKDIVSSNRSKAMLLFAFVFWGIISAINTLYKAIILDIGISEQFSTIVVCIVTIFGGVGSRGVYGIQKVTKRKTLTVFAYALLLSAFVIGIIGICGILNLTTLTILLLALVILGLVQGAYRVAIKQYVLNFTTSQVRIKITSAYYIVENLGRCLILFLSGFILEFTNNSISCLIFAVMSLITMIFILKYMKGKFGLNPEQYEKREINNVEI